MGLWGASDSDESKPKNLTTAEKKEVFANASGWVREAGSALTGNDNTLVLILKFLLQSEDWQPVLVLQT